jgi:hypothetical protein
MLLIEVAERAARMSGLLKRPGVGLNGSEQREVLHILNSLLDGLKTERLFVYQVIRTVFNVKQGQQDYVVGAASDGADWVIEHFEKILGAGFLVPNSADPTLQAEVPMWLLLDFSEWKSIVNKGVTSSQPRVIYYRSTPPVGIATVWPVPQQPSQVVLYTPGQVDEFDDLMDTIEFPQGYREFIEYAWAVAINEGYPNLVMKPSVAQRALDYKSRVMANQLTPLFIRSDEAAMAKPDWRSTGWYDARTWPGAY